MAEDDIVWVRFEWDLTRLAAEPARPAGYGFRIAGAADRQPVLETILSAYRSDPVWQPMITNIEARQRRRVAEDIGVPGRVFLVAENDEGIAAVSAVAIEHPIGQNLITGVCVAGRHQRRGLGRNMMWRSLAMLREMGLTRACVFSRKGAIAEMKIYTMFDPERVVGVEYPDRLEPDSSFP